MNLLRNLAAFLGLLADELSLALTARPVEVVDGVGPWAHDPEPPALTVVR